LYNHILKAQGVETTADLEFVDRDDLLNAGVPAFYVTVLNPHERVIDRVMTTVDINNVERDFLVKVTAGETVETAKLRIFQFTNVRGALTTAAGVPPLDNEFMNLSLLQRHHIRLRPFRSSKMVS
jgi:hypothetical protein